MLTWPLKALFIGTFIFVVALVAFAVRPTPVVGVDGASLGQSVEGFLADSGKCRRLKADGRWRCSKTTADGSSGSSAYVVEVDWWGCWEGRREGPGSLGMPRRLNGCVSLLHDAGI